jgi:predicted short-subunit dehydrogenase-like oxidoreductase (DUF2520 family)
LSNPFNIVIIGTGNVAYHIADSFRVNINLNLIQVFNHRNTKGAKRYSREFNCDLVTAYNAINPNADLYIIAVKDDAIAEVAKNLIPLKLNGIVVHTSGSVDMKVLKSTSSNTGVYYPLQTFYPEATIDWQTTPILLEANSKRTLAKLKKIATSISNKVKVVNSENRLQIHLAAVFACNFTNALYVSAYEIIEKNLSRKDTELLHSIMLQSFHKLCKIHPKKAQTGPAMRNDTIVMKKHLALLKSDKQLVKVYKTLSDLIIGQQKLR